MKDFITGTRYASANIAMVKVRLQSTDTGSEPAPSFPSEDEIKLAEKLRHQLEERYLGPSATTPPSGMPSDKPQ